MQPLNIKISPKFFKPIAIELIDFCLYSASFTSAQSAQPLSLGRNTTINITVTFLFRPRVSVSRPVGGRRRAFYDDPPSRHRRRRRRRRVLRRILRRTERTLLDGVGSDVPERSTSCPKEDAAHEEKYVNRF